MIVSSWVFCFFTIGLLGLLDGLLLWCCAFFLRFSIGCVTKIILYDLVGCCLWEFSPTDSCKSLGCILCTNTSQFDWNVTKLEAFGSIWHVPNTSSVTQQPSNSTKFLHFHDVMTLTKPRSTTCLWHTGTDASPGCLGDPAIPWMLGDHSRKPTAKFPWKWIVSFGPWPVFKGQTVSFKENTVNAHFLGVCSTTVQLPLVGDAVYLVLMCLVFVALPKNIPMVPKFFRVTKGQV